MDIEIDGPDEPKRKRLSSKNENSADVDEPAPKRLKNPPDVEPARESKRRKTSGAPQPPTGKPWFAESSLPEAVVTELERAFASAQLLGTGCDPRAGASYAFLSTNETPAACRAAVEAAVRTAAAAFDLDWRTHAVARLRDDDDDVNLDAKFVRYRPGDRCPPIHLDTSLTVDGRQVANALVYLNDDFSGGETVLDAAAPRPFVVRPRRGRVVLWRSLHYDPVVVERRALHTANPVGHGEKRVLCLAIRARSKRRATL